MTISAFAYGIAGMRAADMRVLARAQNIVNWQSKDYRAAIANQTTGVNDEPIVRITRAELTGDFPPVDLAAEIVDMKMAQRAYQASAAVVRTAAEMSKTLLDTIT
jgi:flagellar hook protein FlgE